MKGISGVVRPVLRAVVTIIRSIITPGGGFTVLNSIGGSFSPSTTILNSSGGSFVVSTTVFNSSGSSYAVI